MVLGVVCSAMAVEGQQTNDGYVRFLVPLSFRQLVSGANGSLWKTDFTLTNTSDRDLLVFPYGTNIVCHCDAPPTPPNSTLSPSIALDDVPQIRGRFMFVDRSRVRDLQMVLRVRDLSRALESWGTTIPIVHEQRFSAETISIVDIPSAPEHRITTRVYGLDGLDATPIQLRLYGREEGDVPARPDVFIGEMTLTLNAKAVRTISGHQMLPAFVELAGVDAFGSASAFQRLRLDITPLREGKKIWAFVSSTNNQTQHVTILEPLAVAEE